MNTDKFKVKGRYEFEIIGTDGVVRDSWSVENLVVNGGLAFLTGNDIRGMKYIAVGTSSTAVAGSQTALVAEITTDGLGRALGAVTQEETNVANDTFQVTKTFTATGSTTIEEIGVFNAPSSGTMLSRALTTSKAIANGESLACTYKLVVSNT